MSLTNKDKAAVRSLWAKVSKSPDDVGAEALARTLNVYPQTKTYFAHWPDLGPNSSAVRKHGSIVMRGVGTAVANIDDLTTGLLDLSEQHAFQLRVDPANFKLLFHCLLVVLAIKYPEEFTPDAHVAYDKFLCAVALALSERYR